MSIKVGFRKVWVKKSLFSNDVHLSMMFIYIYIYIDIYRFKARKVRNVYILNEN